MAETASAPGRRYRFPTSRRAARWRCRPPRPTSSCCASATPVRRSSPTTSRRRGRRGVPRQLSDRRPEAGGGAGQRPGCDRGLGRAHPQTVAETAAASVDQNSVGWVTRNAPGLDLEPDFAVFRTRVPSAFPGRKAAHRGQHRVGRTPDGPPVFVARPPGTRSRPPRPARWPSMRLATSQTPPTGRIP